MSDKTEGEVFEALTGIPVIDAHEHLVPEAERVARKVDFFILFSTYCQADLVSAGMDPAVYERLRNDPDMPPEQKWKAFGPFYPLIRHGSYARPGRIWLRDVLGCDDLTDANYAGVSAKLQEWNRPGLYDRILRKMCGIGAALVVGADYREYDFGLLKPLWRLHYDSDGFIRDFLFGQGGAGEKSLGAYLDRMEGNVTRYAGDGGFAVKTVCFPFETPDLRKAEEVFDSIRAGGPDEMIGLAQRAVLSSVIHDRVFRLVEEHDLTVAVHSGVWGDFRQSQPTYLIPMATQYPAVRFDLFHLGVPFVREAVMIGKMFPNVSLNLCWNTVVSPEQTVRMLDECLDMIPLNRLIVFGADYNLPVEKVYGHLKMAKQVVARVLAKRIRRGDMDLPEAVRIAGMWFHDNAVSIYRL